jgi:hypothetical protein
VTTFLTWGPRWGNLAKFCNHANTQASLSPTSARSVGRKFPGGGRPWPAKRCGPRPGSGRWWSDAESGRHAENPGSHLYTETLPWGSTVPTDAANSTRAPAAHLPALAWCSPAGGPPRRARLLLCTCTLTRAALPQG